MKSKILFFMAFLGAFITLNAQPECLNGHYQMPADGRTMVLFAGEKMTYEQFLKKSYRPRQAARIYMGTSSDPENSYYNTLEKKYVRVSKKIAPLTLATTVSALITAASFALQQNTVAKIGLGITILSLASLTTVSFMQDQLKLRLFENN